MMISFDDPNFDSLLLKNVIFAFHSKWAVGSIFEFFSTCKTEIIYPDQLSSAWVLQEEWEFVECETKHKT